MPSRNVIKTDASDCIITYMLAMLVNKLSSLNQQTLNLFERYLSVKPAHDHTELQLSALCQRRATVIILPYREPFSPVAISGLARHYEPPDAWRYD